MSHNKTRKTLEASAVTNNGINDFKFKGLLTLVDDINLKIIEELVKNPSISSMSLATKLQMPLSSLQRRRDLKASGAKMGDTIINVDKGRSREVATNILKNIKATLCRFLRALTQNIT